MQIILKKTNDIAVLLFSDDEIVSLSPERLEASSLLVTDINSLTHKIVAGPAPIPPLYWVPNALKFNETWTVANQSEYEAYLPRAIELAETEILRQNKKLSQEKAAFILSVKSEAGAFTQQVLLGLGFEYELVEKQAMTYKEAGYPATPIPLSIQDEIESKAAKGITITATVACNTILAAATRWRNAQAALRRNRLTTVSAAEVAVDTAALDVIKTQWSTFMIAMKLQFNV